jgi:polysaccharide deacetylase 2 family uncharacterized protein YibQ
MIWLVVKKQTFARMAWFCLILLVAWLMISRTQERTVSLPLPKGYLALVIDDFGNYGDGTEAMFKLGIPLTAAVIPFLPFSHSDADQAHRFGLEVIIHLSMEPISGKQNWLGPHSICFKSTDSEIQSYITQALEELHWAVGMNNHMGSRVTANRRIMTAVLSMAKLNQLFFVNSKTTDSAVASELARLLNVSYYERDLFLDEVKNPAHIQQQLKQLGKIALQRGYAIGIGHVGPEGGTITARAIARMRPYLEKQGLQFVTVSDLRTLLNAKTQP